MEKRYDWKQLANDMIEYGDLPGCIVIGDVGYFTNITDGKDYELSSDGVKRVDTTELGDRIYDECVDCDIRKYEYYLVFDCFDDMKSYLEVEWER